MVEARYGSLILEPKEPAMHIVSAGAETGVDLHSGRNIDGIMLGSNWPAVGWDTGGPVANHDRRRLR